MLRVSLVTLVVITCSAAEVSAQSKIATLEQPELFEGYPRKEVIGAKGHSVRDEWFTGRWCCAAISAGVLGEAQNVPLVTAPGLPRTNERIVAIVAVDLESETRLCLKIRPEFQPSWETDFDFRVLTKDTFCLLARKPALSGEEENLYILTVSLSDQTVAAEELPRASAERHLQHLPLDAPSDRQPLGERERLPEQRAGPPTSWLGGGLLASDEIDLANAEEPNRLIGPGSRRGRRIQCDVIGPGQFAISEQDAAREQRQYWLLSEEAFQPGSDGKHPKVGCLYFPHILIAPVSNFVLAAAAGDGSTTVFAISDGRLRRLWDAPAGYEIFLQLHLSEDESHIAVELHGDLASSTMTVSIELATGRVTLFPPPVGQWDNLILAGVTNRGDLVQYDGSGSVFIRHGSGGPRQVARLIRDRD